MQLKALLAVLLAVPLAGLQGCVNLPPQLREELRCAAPDNFGNQECDGTAR